MICVNIEDVKIELEINGKLFKNSKAESDQYACSGGSSISEHDEKNKMGDAKTAKDDDEFKEDENRIRKDKKRAIKTSNEGGKKKKPAAKASKDNNKSSNDDEIHISRSENVYDI